MEMSGWDRIISLIYRVISPQSTVKKTSQDKGTGALDHEALS